MQYLCQHAVTVSVCSICVEIQLSDGAQLPQPNEINKRLLQNRSFPVKKGDRCIQTTVKQNLKLSNGATLRFECVTLLVREHLLHIEHVRIVTGILVSGNKFR